jgi:hypothetical protein
MKFERYISKSSQKQINIKLLNKLFRSINSFNLQTSPSFVPKPIRGKSILIAKLIKQNGQ